LRFEIALRHLSTHTVLTRFRLLVHSLFLLTASSVFPIARTFLAMNTPDSLKKRVKRKRRVEDLEEHEVISFVDDDVEEENVTVTETSSISIT